MDRLERMVEEIEAGGDLPIASDANNDNMDEIFRLLMSDDDDDDDSGDDVRLYVKFLFQLITGKFINHKKGLDTQVL